MTKFPSHTIKAFFSTSVFMIVGIANWVVTAPNTHILPIFIFYIILVVHTFFSINLFASIIRKDDMANNVIDTILAILYIGMALNLSQPVVFTFLILLLFIIATIKYAFLLNKVPHPKLLQRKISADALGAVMCTLVLGGVFAGYTTQSLWAMTIVFAIANILLFFVWPLYRLDS